MHGADGLFEPVAAHYDDDGRLAPSLRDGDDVHLLAQDDREDAARETRLAHYCKAATGNRVSALLPVAQTPYTWLVLV